MTAINHALTGSLIGLIVGEPLLAVPLAVVSHFVCDAIPHFGGRLPPEVSLKTKWFRNYLITDASLCVALVVCLLVVMPRHWLLSAICAFAAASPDLLSMNRFFKTRAGRPWKAGRYVTFAKNIQWFEQPIGAVVEVAWFVAAIVLLVPFLK
ncbi:MAG: hypothetical protein WA843_05020 [Candidatus Saccharimonadales bacterium]